MKLPADGTKCDPDPDVEMPSWWQRLPADVSGAVTIDATTMRDAMQFKASEVYLQAWGVPGTKQKDLLSDYDVKMATAGFTNSDDPKEISGGLLKYYCDGNDCVGVLVLDATALATPDWESVSKFVPANHCLVVYLYFPE
jgi:hypothetical protein